MNWIRCCRDEQQLCLACLKHSNGSTAVCSQVPEWVICVSVLLFVLSCFSPALKVDRLLFLWKFDDRRPVKKQRFVLKKSPKNICLFS
jgi:hypothetical protein